jgi:hypothetical protein
VRLERRSATTYSNEMAYPSFKFYKEHAKTLSAAMAVLGVPPMQIDDDVERTSVSFTTPNYFSELGARAPYGRLLDPVRDEGSGAPPVLVMSYGLWRGRFAADPSVIGRTIRLNNKPITVAGVAPYELATLGGQHPDMWLPIAEQPYLFEGSKVLDDFNSSSVQMWGRLAPGVTAAAAEQELRALTDELRRQHPMAVWDGEFLQSSPGGHMQVMPPEMYRAAAMVGLLSLLILAVACGNLGALLLARAVQREREIGIRLAVGANRGRIFRQLCTESLLLASLGAVAGLALGWTKLVDGRSRCAGSDIHGGHQLFGGDPLRANTVAADCPARAAQNNRARTSRGRTSGRQLCPSDRGWSAGSGDPSRVVQRSRIWIRAFDFG